MGLNSMGHIPEGYYILPYTDTYLLIYVYYCYTYKSSKMGLVWMYKIKFINNKNIVHIPNGFYYQKEK